MILSEQVVWYFVPVNRHAVCKQIVVMAEDLHAGKTNPYLEGVSISGGINHQLLHMESA